ncbi:hypothetical protein PAHAL_1G158000 [Panicum hallii]|uniref:Uncharacterized protein n=1 Tax=Panicum hallii TaxID=206008 RepID=A0A2T8KVD5_9POAL|nr:hypothetical protein PAHAL_1G158000 [Panicum hallii]
MRSSKFRNQSNRGNDCRTQVEASPEEKTDVVVQQGRHLYISNPTLCSYASYSCVCISLFLLDMCMNRTY